jgi:hypothetical protein
MPATTFDEFSCDLTPDTRRVAFERRADKALAAYFACPPADRTTKAHATVATVLAALKPHQRGALAMYHTPRAWPEALVAVCQKDTSLVVRLYCADHPTVGPAAEVEAAAAQTLAAKLSAGRTGVVDNLHWRALEHALRAEAAFLKAFEAHCSAAR